MKKLTTYRDRIITSGLTAVLALAGWTVVAQQAQAPPPQGQQPAGAAPPNGGRADGAGPAAGRGGPNARGGRGPQGLPFLGGGQANDPAYLNVDFSAKDAVKPVTPEEQVKRIWLPDGYRVEPILSEPDIQDPGQIAFDGNGRMYVVELRGYMRDLEGSNQLDPISRISWHEDRNNDGVYETHGVFVDQLVLPRWVMPLGKDAVLTMESNGDDVYKFTDADRDGVAEKKEIYATGFGRLTNVELQQASLTWAMDNWMYSTVNQFRIRWTPNGLLKEPTGPNGAQWGVTQDNYGKLWFQGGGSGLPTQFQFHVAYGRFIYPQALDPTLRTMWGAPVGVADGVVGMNDVRLPDGSMVSTTAGAGNDIFRGDRLPADLIGDYIYGEPVGRIVRRVRATKREGLTTISNYYPYAEFIRSTDPLFRPVDMTTAPDGTMYITDMYRGVVEEKQWNQPGWYIQARIKQYSLDKVTGHGRIFRVTYQGMPRDTRQPRMLNETPAQLVAHLSHPNGWWRDTAQQLLVLAQDKSVVPALTRLARTSTNQLARIHALWTLEGLNAADAALVRTLMADTDPQIRQQAIRVSETLYKSGDRSFAADYVRLMRDTDADVVIQTMMTANMVKSEGYRAAVQTTKDSNRAAGVQLVAETILGPAQAPVVGRFETPPPALTEQETASLRSGETAYAQTCASCHAADGFGGTQAPSLAGAARVIGHKDYIVKTLLQGMTGPINGRTYAAAMPAHQQMSDEQIAAVTSYVRYSFGNQAPLITTQDVAQVRAATASRTMPWTLTELDMTLPRQAVPTNAWRVTASHNAASARDALTHQAWTTGQPQEAGQWLQVELASATMLSEIQFQSTQPAAGGGGRGGGGAAPAPPNAGPGVPRQFQVQVSNDGATWRTVAEARGAGLTTRVPFAPVSARFARITLTGNADAFGSPWNVMLMRLFEAPAATR